MKFAAVYATCFYVMYQVGNGIIAKTRFPSVKRYVHGMPCTGKIRLSKAGGDFVAQFFKNFSLEATANHHCRVEYRHYTVLIRPPGEFAFYKC